MIRLAGHFPKALSFRHAREIQNPNQACGVCGVPAGVSPGAAMIPLVPGLIVFAVSIFFLIVSFRILRWTMRGYRSGWMALAEFSHLKYFKKEQPVVFYSFFLTNLLIWGGIFIWSLVSLLGLIYEVLFK